MNKNAMIATGLAGAALVSIFAVGTGTSGLGDAAFANAASNGPDQGMTMQVGQRSMNGAPVLAAVPVAGMAPTNPMVPAGGMAGGNPAQDGVQQALEGLAQIRQEQCQSGNQLACQALPSFSGIRDQLSQLGQSCQSGDAQACGSYRGLSEKIFTSYSESAAVMRQGAEGMAQMNAWRNQMNANAAASMSNLQAMGARGQAAHAARQESYAAMNNNWAANQASSDRIQGRFVDGIYEGTTMSGGGVQARIDYGRTGYADGYGNVVTAPEGSSAPDGYQEMTPTYAAPE